MNKEGIYIKAYSKAKGWLEVNKALNAAIILHGDQKRKTGEDYIIHPIRLACHLIALGVESEKTIATALLHDCLEDCSTNKYELHTKYGISEEICEMVDLLTKKKGMTTEYYYDRMKGQVEVILVKAVDRCHNVSTMGGVFSTEKIREYIQETQEYVYPLCRYGKNYYPEYSDVIYSIKYHISSICETLKAVLELNKGIQKQ